MDGRTESLPILQDFVPCWGRCPPTLCNCITSERQGKGTADLMMPLGVLFPPSPGLRSYPIFPESFPSPPSFVIILFHTVNVSSDKGG